MDITELVKSSQYSVASPDGKHVATLNGSRFEIRRVSTFEIVRTIDVPSSRQSRFLCIKWSPITKGAGVSERILLSDEDTTRVWDLQDEDWSATIDNGSGGTGKVANVEFGSDDTEVMVYSSFGAAVTIWSLWTGRSVEIKDPKFSTKGYGRNRMGRSGIFAILTRPAAQDMISLHAPGSYAPIKSFSIPTVDAQGLKWSKDGRWLAVWDNPGTGYKVLIYTRDGNLFRSYTGDYFDDDLIGLGIKTLEWSPNGDFLAVSGFEDRVALLSTRTFCPATHLSHPTTIKICRGQMWQEQVTSSDRSYVPITQPFTPPAATPTPGDTTPKSGVSVISFNADGNLLATKDDNMPTVVWIWDLSQMCSRAILVQHSVVKRLHWHPTDTDTLLVQCIQGDSIVYSWNASIGQPRILHLGPTAFSGKAEAQWIPKQPQRKPVLMYGDTQGYLLAYPEGIDESPSPMLEPSSDDAQSVSTNHEEDSLYDILSGKAHAHPQEDVTAAAQFRTGLDFGSPNGAIDREDDTFHYRKRVGVC